MTVTELASALKRRQRRHLSSGLFRSIDDEDMVWSYLTCPECQQKLVTNFVPLIQEVKSVQEFAEMCNLIIGVHEIEAHGRGVYQGHPDQGGRQITADDLRRQLPPSVCLMIRGIEEE